MRSLAYVNPNGLTVSFASSPYVITKLTGVDSPDFKPQEQGAPYQDGSTYIDGIFDTRDIVVEGAIASAPGDLAAIATARRLIVAALNPKEGVGTLTYTWDGGSYQIPAIPVSSPVFASRQATDPYQRFQVTFHAPDPLWQSTTLESETLEYLGASLEFDPDIEFAPDLIVSELGGIGGQSVTMTNSGDVSCPVVVRFYGPAENPKITNVTTGDYIRVEYTLTANDFVEIDTAFGQKTVILSESGVESSAMQYLDLSSVFFQLATGTNELKFEEDGTNVGSSAYIEFRERYIGA